MRYSQLFPKTQRQAPAGAESVNHKLLVRAGFIDQLMAGSWTLLPLGFRVMEKIKNIIREELNKTGAQEMLMPLLHPRGIWDQTGRWSDPAVKEVMYQFKDIHGREFGLSFTHEEIVMDLIKKYVHSYKDLPITIYHFSTKFRNEPRAKSGILRGREFMMKDLYSAHGSEEEMFEYYYSVRDAYLRIYQRMDLDAKVVEASGGVFTKNHTHEFQVITPVGEDTIYYCQGCDFAQNIEIFEGKEGDKCPRCGGVIKSANSIEVGNIFPFGQDKYAKLMDVLFKNASGADQLVYFASYGIGVSRLIGTLVEVFHDDKGIIWPESVAPFKVHIVGLDLEDDKIKKEAESIHQRLEGEGIEVLYDDRTGISAGEKFADADLIGIPYRVVVSAKTKGQLEVKKRSEKQTNFLSLEEFAKKLQPN